MSATCSTHVLDAARGRPAAGLRVALADAAGRTLVEAVTDADGRVRFDADLEPGMHALGFETGAWFAADGRDCFHPHVDVAFTAADGEHHHVALLLSPFAYTTYRGS
ncbi:hydroxyisourate hydrolase [Nocardioides solisilvae]|uniref:hydroxyisourate hydrolase n=1 Tax=Nocardioides solisilvae TaxID=1542435 RepID=UPI000D74037E|nr:hydroxyisourate hydrolase [Nocardioides solisilvae]